MAITPPSDLVLDVAQAVDPVQYRESVQKLHQMQAAAKADAAPMSFAELADMRSSSTAAPAAPNGMAAGRPGEAYQKFEAFMLQTFIQEMFTSDTPAVFGKGPGSDYWKSMMAELIAGEMAKGGGIGVAKMLESRQQLIDPKDVTTGASPVGEIAPLNGFSTTAA